MSAKKQNACVQSKKIKVFKKQNVWNSVTASVDNAKLAGKTDAKSWYIPL